MAGAERCAAVVERCRTVVRRIRCGTRPRRCAMVESTLCRRFVRRRSVVESPSSIDAALVPIVSAAIVGVGMRATHVEVVPVSIARIDVEREVVSAPPYRAIEVTGHHIDVILPGREHITEIHVTTSPVYTVQVGKSSHAIEVVKIDFIYCCILLCVKTQFIGHLVAEEQSFVTSLCVCHCGGGDGYRHHHCQSHHLFHNGTF